MRTLQTRNHRRNASSQSDFGRRARGVPAHPRRSNNIDARGLPRICIYAVGSNDRLGSLQQRGDTFEAFDRLGRLLGTTKTQGEAIAAIRSGGKS